MTILTQIATFVVNFLETVPNEYYSRAFAYLAAGICCIAPAMSCLGEGLAAMKAVEAIGRQPDASGKITVTMIIGQAITETGALYGFIMAIMLVNK